MLVPYQWQKIQRYAIAVFQLADKYGCYINKPSHVVFKFFLLKLVQCNQKHRLM